MCDFFCIWWCCFYWFLNGGEIKNFTKNYESFLKEENLKDFIEGNYKLKAQTTKCTFTIMSYIIPI